MTPEWAIVIGGSAGALPPLREIVAALPRNLPAAVLVVIHTPAHGGVHLSSVIARWTTWPVVAVESPQGLLAGHLYLATADRHLKVTANGVESTREVREHHTRPAIDVLFRSVARAFRSRTIAVVLSGYGGDGTAGALAIRARGGTVIVQEPATADIASMPLRAAAAGAATTSAPAAEIGRIIQETMSRGAAGDATMAPEENARRMIADDIREQERGDRSGQVTVLSCPDCGGVMWQMTQGTFVDFSCHIGHRFGPDTLLVQKTEQLEAALVSALRLLKEKAILLRQTANRAKSNGHLRAAERLDEQASIDERYAELLRRELLEAEPSSLANAAVEEDVATSEAVDPPG